MRPLTIRALAQFPIWVGWRIEIRNNRPVKIPYNPANGRRAETDNPNTWRGRIAAESWSSNSDGDGVGLMLAGIGDFHLGGIDLDTCRDKVSGSVAGWAQEVIDRFASYTEISPSGTGLKIFFTISKSDYAGTGPIFGSDGNGERFGRAFKNGNGEGKSPGIEVYRGLRYFTVTEDAYGDNDELRCVTLADLRWLITEVGPKFAGSGVNGDKRHDETRSAQAWRAVWPMLKRGASYEEMKAALLKHKLADVREWANTKGMEKGERELKRIYDRTVRDDADADFRIQTSDEFIADWRPDDWFVDGVLQRGYLYSLTGVTGHGKTAVAMRLALSVYEASEWGGVACDRGDVIYFAGENPDDVRSRWIAMGGKGVHFIVGTQISLRDDIALIKAEVERLGIAPALIVVDTKAAFFEDEKEDDNVQSQNQASDLRELTELPGRPALIVLCHPTKYAKTTEQLIPRGGGAFLAAIDTNLTCIIDDDGVVKIHHTKVRGPDFEQLEFMCNVVELPSQYKDTKGRPSKSVVATTATEAEIERKQKQRSDDEDRVLRTMLKKPGASLSEIAKTRGWVSGDEKPYKMKVQRIMNKLKERGWVENDGDHYRLTPAGERAAEESRPSA